MNFYWKPTCRHIFMVKFPSKTHGALFLYADKGGISLGNNWGGQLQNPIHAGVYWSHFWKHGIRAMFHRTVGARSKTITL